MISIEDTREWFAKTMREEMDFHELTLSDVSRDCMIDRNKLNNYVQARSLPNPYVLSKLADYFECTVNDLLDFDEPDDDSLLGYDLSYIFEDEDEFVMHIRNRIEQHMLDSRISITDLSERTGFNKHTIKYWLGMLKKQPTLIRTSDLLRICDALDCTPSDLLGY